MSEFAWVTLATNDSYSLGALVLAHSLRQNGTAHQLAVLVTTGVTNAMRKNLADVFNVVEEVNIFDSKDEANLKLLKRPELGVTFTKLHCWRLTQFQKCIFLDADVLVLVNSDELFERQEFSAAPDVGWPDCFNSGVFVYKPSLETYNKLVDFALQRGSFDGGDQGLLNAYFSDWAHKDISKHLPFIYNMCSTACYSYLPAFKFYGPNVKIVHFIGPAKPWLQYFDTESRKVHPSTDLQHLHDVLQKWWDIFCSLIHPKLSPDMSGLAGAFAQFTLGVKRSPYQDALENHLRRQAWEVGNIDYMGRDSFDNIWNKICQSLSSTQLGAAPVKVEAVSSSASQQVPEVANDNQEIPAATLTAEQPQEIVAQTEVSPKPQEEISPPPVASEPIISQEELATVPASSEVPPPQPEATTTEVSPPPQSAAISISEVPPQQQPEAANVSEVLQVPSEAAPVSVVPQVTSEVAPVPEVPQVTPDAALVPDVAQVKSEAAPIEEATLPQQESVPVQPEAAPVQPEALPAQIETVPSQPKSTTVQEAPQSQPEIVPSQEKQPELPVLVQEISQIQPETAPIQEVPAPQPEAAPVQEVHLATPEAPAAISEVPAVTEQVVRPDVIPQTEVASTTDISIPQEESRKPTVQPVETPQPTQQTEPPPPIEDPKADQIEVKSQEVSKPEPSPTEIPIAEPVPESIHPSVQPKAEIPIEKPVETPVLKEELALDKKEEAPAVIKSAETKGTAKLAKVKEPSKEPVSPVAEKAPVKEAAPSAKLPKEPESAKAVAAAVESTPAEPSAEVPKSDAKPKETRKIKKKVKKVPKAEGSGEGPDGTSKK